MQAIKAPQLGKRNKKNDTLEIATTKQTQQSNRQTQSSNWHYPLDLRIEPAQKSRATQEIRETTRVPVTIKKRRTLRHE